MPDKDVVEVQPMDLTVYDGPQKYSLQLLEHGVDVDRIEKMLELQERFEANEARKAFFDAMSKAQADMPTVKEDTFNKQTNSWYPSYKALAAACKPVYTSYGLSMVFYEGDCPKDDQIRIYCDITHSLGHTETKYTDMPLDAVGIKGSVNKTPIQAKGSSFSYGRSYLMRLIWNLPTSEHDDDGQAPDNEFINPDQVKILTDLANETKADVEGFLNAVCEGAETIDTIPARLFNHAQASLKNKLKVQKKKAAKKQAPRQREPGDDDGDLPFP